MRNIFLLLLVILLFLVSCSTLIPDTESEKTNFPEENVNQALEPIPVLQKNAEKEMTSQTSIEAESHENEKIINNSNSYFLDEAMMLLTRDIINRSNIVSVEKLAINDLSTIENEYTLLGKYIAEELVNSFLKSEKDFSIVERNKLQEALNELKLNMSVMFSSQENLKKVGNFVGADALITGIITPFDTYMKVNIKVFSVETSEVLSASSIRINNTPEVQKLYATVIADEAFSVNMQTNSKNASDVASSEKESELEKTNIETDSENDEYVFYEDFTTIEEGMYPEGWFGVDEYMVKEFNGSKHLMPYTNNHDTTITVLPFELPDDFEFSLRFYLESDDFGITIEIGDLKLRISRRYSRYISFGDMNSSLENSYLKEDSEYVMQIIKKDKIIKAYSNGKQMTLFRLNADIKDVDRIHIDLKSGTYYLNEIYIKSL